jgi:hypothetical protein
MKPDAELLQSYRDARYVVSWPDPSATQILLDHANRALDELPHTHEHHWALLNPGNARSAPWPDACNERRMERLQRLLRQRHLRFSAAESYAQDGSWSERGVLIHGIELTELDALAIRFGQHATIIGAATRPAKLRLYGRGWWELHPHA